MPNTALLTMEIQTAKTGETPLRQEWRRTWEPAEGMPGMSVRAATDGATVSLAEFSTVDSVIVRNRSSDAAESVRASFASIKETETFPSGVLTWSNSSPPQIASSLSDFVARGFVAPGRVRVENSGLAGNDGAYVLVEVASNQIEVPYDVSFPSTGADPGTPTLYVEIENYLDIPSGGLMVVEDIYPADDLILTSASGTPRCDIWVLGS